MPVSVTCLALQLEVELCVFPETREYEEGSTSTLANLFARRADRDLSKRCCARPSSHEEERQLTAMSENPNTYEEVCRPRLKVRRCQRHSKEIFGNPYPSQRDVRETPGKSAMVSRGKGDTNHGLKVGVESCRDYVDFMIIGRGNCYFEQVLQGVPPASKSNVRHLSRVLSAEPITVARPMVQLALILPTSPTEGN